ncbi:MAG TPA: sugar nucleotide-binding protein [Kofleriaceae bacterium]|nr:sugar nucleotide-binding protein [Kofleriaceae bacterium]
MKVLVTGLRGTVGRALAARLAFARHEVVGWNRDEVPIDDYWAMDRFVAHVAPDAIVNLAIASRPTGRAGEQWLVNHEWPSELAWIARQRSIKLVHASTVMVFAPTTQGPFTVESVADAPCQPDQEAGGYGYVKRMAEARVLAQNPDATVVRLGWQIGHAPGSNHMIDFFDRQMREGGRIHASAHLFPACSFLDDTADGLVRALRAPPGLYLADGNERWSLLQIARALAPAYGWVVLEADTPVRDERMSDPRLAIASIAQRLPTLLDA